MGQVSFKVYVTVALVFPQQTISERLKSVARKTNMLDLDKFMFSENCDGVCSSTGGFQVEQCCCYCHQDTVFVISREKCVQFHKVHRFILSETSPTVNDSSKISKYTISSLQQGIGLYYCNTTSCKNNFTQCQISSAYTDRSKWTPLWNQDESPTITISMFNILKVNWSIPPNEYNGQLLRLNVTCLQKGYSQQQISGELLIEVAGTYEIPVAEPATIALIPSTKNSTTPISTTTTNTNTTTSSTNSGTVDQGKMEEDDKKMLLVYIIASSILSFLIALCIVILIYRRCRRKQTKQKRCSDPVSAFQPTSPVFLIDSQGSNFGFTEVCDPIYDQYHHSKKGVTIRNFYAHVGKKIKKKNKESSSSGSLDDGYNTGEEDYNRSFSSIPRDLCSYIGSNISLNEPEYRIPEDLNYLADNRPPSNSSYCHTSVHNGNDCEAKKDQGAVFLI